MTKNTNKKMPKNAINYYCEKCDFKCIKLSNWESHVLTRKHEIRTNTNMALNKNAKIYTCDCGKKYTHASSLWNHKQKCNLTHDNSIKDINPIPVAQNTILGTNDESKIVTMLLQQNQEFKDLLLDQNKTIIELSKNNQTINNTHTNSHNKTFNLHFFLNETCKDAMNLSDFVKGLQLNFAELEKMGEIGFAEGLSRMFVRGLNELDITKRPIHCTDVKRDILHIKNEGKWERETADQQRIKKAIKQIENRNVMHLYDWKDAHPGCGDWDSKINTKFLKMQYEAMGSGGEEQELKDYKKIIRKVSENTIIDKEKYKNL